MKRWFVRNVRLALWIHASFLFVVVLCVTSSRLNSILVYSFITVFLPHTIIAQLVGGFDSSDDLQQRIVPSTIAVILSFPVSLLYATLVHWFIQRRRRRHTVTSNV